MFYARVMETYQRYHRLRAVGDTHFLCGASATYAGRAGNEIIAEEPPVRFRCSSCWEMPRSVPTPEETALVGTLMSVVRTRLAALHEQLTDAEFADIEREAVILMLRTERNTTPNITRRATLDVRISQLEEAKWKCVTV